MSDDAGRVCTFWAPVTDEGHRAIAEAKWRSWPPTAKLHATEQRDDAVAGAMAYAREFGVGYVVRYDLKTAPGRGPLDALDIDTLSSARALASAIIEESQYRARVEEDEIGRAEASMGRRFPAAWRAYIQRPSWFSKGWLPKGSLDGTFVWLYTPAESLDIALVWHDLDITPPGMIPIGNDGSSQRLTVDARKPESLVAATDNVEVSWEDSFVQCPSVEAFIRSIDDETFRFVFDDAKKCVT